MLLTPEFKKNEKTVTEEINNLKANKVDKQRTEKTVNASGYYRVAELGNADAIGLAFFCSVYTRYWNTNNCSYLLGVNVVHGKAKISLISSLLINESTKAISKVRIAKHNSKLYLELYYNYNVQNPFYCELLGNENKITMLSPTLAEENETVLHELGL